MAACDEGVYFVLNNIPVHFRSADLRNYFSQFIESGGFVCFHYRHRPEIRLKPAQTEGPPGATTTTTAARAGAPEQIQADQSENGSVDEASDDKPSTSDDIASTSDDKPSTSDDKPSTSDDKPSTSDDKPSTSDDKASPGEQKGDQVCCCVVSVRPQDSDRFGKMYAGNQWIDSKGNWLSKRCLIRRIKVSDHTDPDLFPYKTKAELRRPTAHGGLFTRAHLKALPELNPPALMPAGNVGTRVTVFLQLIQSCRLPPRLIRRLGLTFPKTGSNRRYGNVPYHYKTGVVAAGEESVFTAGGAEICGPGRVAPPKSPGRAGRGRGERPVREETPERDSEEEQSGPDDDDDRCEEWERHEALHEDVTSQERSKERLYEEEIELKWEKGGSGLVFYTDAQYWQEEEGDFDEQTADDWDVDMSVYYDKDGGDMDSRDYVRMRYETRLRAGEEQESCQRKIGTFERFTKGVGRRVMEKQGWKEGEGLGHSSIGMSEALENEGQHPHCRRGFGYHGEKLSSFQPQKKPRTEFHISTVYDEPKDVDRGDTLYRRQHPASMKHSRRRAGGSDQPGS
ncbi:G patch domain-containing protein 3 [Trichomycterus rosablanca]|uniref:G patch domain-containing protein 3 n=1 Tax=Trichomycterus rosablanca TaxID=2290929 RepID=UPI002F3592CB